jgi:hypothetical protein
MKVAWELFTIQTHSFQLLDAVGRLAKPSLGERSLVRLLFFIATSAGFHVGLRSSSLLVPISMSTRASQNLRSR